MRDACVWHTKLCVSQYGRWSFDADTVSWWPPLVLWYRHPQLTFCVWHGRRPLTL